MKKATKVVLALAALLLAVGFDVWLWRALDHRPQFALAVRRGNLVEVEALLKKHPSLANASHLDREGRNWTALHIAAYTGNAAMIDLLVKYHARTEPRDNRGLTPLLWTTFVGNPRAAAALLSNGADINARGNDGRTSLELAKLSMNKELIELLRERGAKE